MLSEPFKPFLINDRSSALINFIDASQFTESELVDVYLGMCDRLKHLIELTPPLAYEVYNHSHELANELVQGIIKDCHNAEPIRFEVAVHEAYMILALMQTAIAKLQVPDIENISEFGEKFINAFCDRHKENLPNICRSLQLGWLPTYQMAREEFDDLVDDDDFEPFHGDGHDRYVENLITDLDDSQTSNDDSQASNDTYVDDFE